MIIDLQLFNFINGFARRWQWLDWIGIFCAVYLGYVLFLFLGILVVVRFKKYWRMVAEAFLAAIFVRFVLVKIFYAVLFRYRPFVNDVSVNLLIPFNSGRTSFPSGHASFYFALSMIIYGYNRRMGTWFFAASLLIAVARVFVGVHWPSDVVIGAVIGISMGWLLNKLFKKVAPLTF